MNTTWLYDFKDGRPHAFSTDHQSWFLANGEYWAFATPGWLHASTGGGPLGWFSGAIFFDANTHEPLYFMA
jgi:hypothetical protein